MEALSWSGPGADRIVSMAFDEELDQYRLLAYLQRVDGCYRERKLYPYLDELRIRVAQLMGLRERKAELQAALPREVTGVDLEHHEIKRAGVNEDEVVRAIDSMLERGMSGMQHMLDLGMTLRDELVGRIRFAPVGIMPLSTREGYLFLRQGREASAYLYALPLLRESEAPLQYRSVRTRYVTTFTVGLSCSYEQMKAELVKHSVDLPNPATFVFESDISLPRMETFMPLAKQLIYEVIAP
jgi:hypothetical protein